MLLHLQEKGLGTTYTLGLIRDVLRPLGVVMLVHHHVMYSCVHLRKCLHMATGKANMRSHADVAPYLAIPFLAASEKLRTSA